MILLLFELNTIGATESFDNQLVGLPARLECQPVLNDVTCADIAVGP